MTLYKVYIETPQNIRIKYLGAVELHEDDRISLHTMNKDGLYYEVAALQEGIDL